MTRFPRIGRQQGAVLIVGLIVLMLITLMVTAAFKFSTYNLKAVGNMQSHNEAIASANKAIEQTIATWNFTSPPSADEIGVDIDNDGDVDYVVAIDAPTCLRATPSRTAGDAGSECIPQKDGTFICPASTAAANIFNVIWDVPATATGNNGARVRVRQGVSLSLTKSQCTATCPPGVSQACQ